MKSNCRNRMSSSPRGIWRKVLHRPHRIHSFFGAGRFHRLHQIAGMAREVGLWFRRTTFEHPTIVALAAAVSAIEDARRSGRRFGARTAYADTALVLRVAEPGPGHWNQSVTLQANEPSMTTFKQAVSALMSHHDILAPTVRSWTQTQSNTRAAARRYFRLDRFPGSATRRAARENGVHKRARYRARSRPAF